MEKCRVFAPYITVNKIAIYRIFQFLYLENLEIKNI